MRQQPDVRHGEGTVGLGGAGASLLRRGPTCQSRVLCCHPGSRCLVRHLATLQRETDAGLGPSQRASWQPPLSTSLGSEGHDHQPFGNISAQDKKELGEGLYRKEKVNILREIQKSISILEKKNRIP